MTNSFISFQSRIDQMQRRLNAEEELLSSLTEHNPEAVAILIATTITGL